MDGNAARRRERGASVALPMAVDSAFVTQVTKTM
jgi:hypothetical protein